MGSNPTLSANPSDFALLCDVTPGVALGIPDAAGGSPLFVARSRWSLVGGFQAASNRWSRKKMKNVGRDHEHWARTASQWIAWARAPNHDSFWAYRSSLIDFIGQGEGDALEVGCGEGRVSRVLRECGYRVTATDPVEPFVKAAEQAGSADSYRVAPATDLPFKDGSFDLAVAYNVLMDIEDVPAALKEIKRVLRPSGTLLISIVHPFADRGRFADHEPGAAFVRETSYFGRERFEGVEERDGLQMYFAGWSQPLQDYFAALENTGLAVTSLREPVPDAGQIWTQMRRWARVPLFLWLKVRSLAT